MLACPSVLQFLQDILDTLFSILDDNTDKYGPLVFQSLVRENKLKTKRRMNEPDLREQSKNEGQGADS